MRKTIISLILFMFSVSLACVQAEPKKAKLYGGTLVWGVAYKPTLINPVLTTQSISLSLEPLLFNSLIRWNSKGEIEPDLAEKWDLSADGLVYTFHLKKGVRFHDGVECTAADVQFTFDKIIDPQVHSPFRSLFGLVQAFKAVDAYTFQVVLTKPSPSFIFRLMRYIMPQHLLKDADLANASFNVKPIGTGPFRFKEWTRDDQIILEYNPDYYEGRPYLDKIMVKTYADSRQLWSALMRQEVDLVLFIEKDDYEIIKNDSAYKAHAFPSDYYYSVVYNLGDPILADKMIRQAIAMAIDRKSLIERIASGYGLECSGPFYPDSIGFNPQVKPVAFDPDKALQLLAEAGWRDTDKDGILEKNGEKLDIRILVDRRSDVYYKIAMLLRQQLAEIGVRLKVQLFNDDKMLTEEFLRQNRSSVQLQMLLAGIDPDTVEIDWLSKGLGGVYNLGKYRNPGVERYFALGKTTQDELQRRQVYREIHRLIYADQPVCFLYFPFCFHAVSSRLDNTDELFSLSMPFHTLKEWSVKQGATEKNERR